MAYYGSNLVTGSTAAAALTASPTYHRPPTTAAQAGQIVHERAVISFASGVNPATSDVIEMLTLPAGHVLVDFALSWSDFDSGTGAATKAGVMTGTPGDVTRALATVGVEILPTGATSLQAVGVARHGVVAAGVTAASAAAFQALGASAVDRSIGIGIETQAATPIAATRTITLDVWYKPAN